MDNTVRKKRPLIVRFFKYFFPWKGDRPGEVIRKIIMLIAIAVFAVSAWYIADYYYTRWKSQEEYNKITDYYLNGTAPSLDPESSENGLSGFEYLLSINQDVKGFISIEDTNISYPVVQTTDNDYYLYKNIYREYDIFGTPFLDYRCTLEADTMSNNLLIYGHHMNGYRVFGQLVYYSDVEFYKAHPIVRFDTIYEEAKWKILAVFVTNIDPGQDNGNVFDYQNYIDMDEESFNTYIDEVKKRSYFNTDIDVQYGDQLLSLSTCSYEFTDARTVLVARKVREGESADVDTGTAATNNDLYLPAVMSN